MIIHGQRNENEGTAPVMEDKGKQAQTEAGAATAAAAAAGPAAPASALQPHETAEGIQLQDTGKSVQAPPSSSTIIPAAENQGSFTDVVAADRSSSSFAPTITGASTTTLTPSSSTTTPAAIRQKYSTHKQAPPPALHLVSSASSSRAGTPALDDGPAASIAGRAGTPTTTATIGSDDEATTLAGGSPVSRKSKRLNSAFFEELDDAPILEREVRRASVRRMKVAYSGGSLRESITGPDLSGGAGGTGATPTSGTGSIYAPGGSSRGRWRDQYSHHFQQPHSPSSTPQQPSTPSQMYPPETISVPPPTAAGFSEWERRQWAARGSVGTAGERSITGTAPDQIHPTDSVTSQNLPQQQMPQHDDIALLADEKTRVQSSNSGSFAVGGKSRIGTEDTMAPILTTNTTRSQGRISLNGTSTKGSKRAKKKAKRREEGKKGFWKGAWDWVRTLKGFLITVYMLNVIAWGGMLFLLLINAAPAMCHPRSCNYLYSSRRIWVETTSQILNALFCLPAFGLIPWRFRDLYLLFKDRPKLREIHGWEWKGKGEYIIVLMFVANTLWQVALAGLMWGMTRFNRPAWATGFLVVMGCGSAGFAGGWEWWEGRKLKKARAARETNGGDVESGEGGGLAGDGVVGGGAGDVTGVNEGISGVRLRGGEASVHGSEGGDAKGKGIEEEEEEEEEESLDAEKGSEKRDEGGLSPPPPLHPGVDSSQQIPITQ